MIMVKYKWKIEMEEIMKRSCGILMHISSLPSKYGIGTLGKEAFKFVDFLKASGQGYWQVLPVTPTGYSDSPYQSASTFAGNPYLIDLNLLIEEGLLTEEEKIRLCDIVSECGADFIKTSTGFSKGGATREDVKLMRERCPDTVKVKAAGGISSLQDAEDFLALGAERLGTSRIVKIAMEQNME